MKRLVIALTAFAVLYSVERLAAQPSPAPLATPPPPAVPVLGAPPSPADPFDPPPPPPPINPPRPVRDVAERVKEMAMQLTQNAFTDDAEDWVRSAGAVAKDLKFDFDTAMRRNQIAGRILVVPGASVEPQAMSEMEEDLTVMSRLIEKNLARKSDEGDARRSDFELQSLFGSSSAPRSVYLDGYGALFLLRVKFPLLPPAKKDETVTTPPPTPGPWEETHEELFGGKRITGELAYGAVFKPAKSAEPYDADKVERLKESLLGVARHAAKIRHLKPSEFVTIVVAGPEAVADKIVARKVKRKPGAESTGTVELEVQSVAKAVDSMKNPPARGGSTLIVRAKKSDIDDLSRDKLSAEDFRQRATVLVYSSPDASAARAKTPVF